MSFHCTVVTPEQQVIDASVTQAILPAHDGLVGLLTDRSPLLVKLGIGPLRLDLADRKQVFYLIDGGIAQMLDNKLTIVTEWAIGASEIEYDSAIAEYASARAKSQVCHGLAEREQIAHDMKLAQEKLKMSHKP